MDKLTEEKKRAFVTGGGTGIGRASAMALAAEGYFVTVAGRTESTLNETVRLITEAGGSAQAVKADVTVESMVQAAVVAAAGDEGRLDVAVNSAGYDGSAALPTSEQNKPSGAAAAAVPFCAQAARSADIARRYYPVRHNA